MKSVFAVAIVTLISTAAWGEQNCDAGIANLFASISPTASTLVVRGTYTQKSKKTGNYLPCEVGVKKTGNRLQPITKPDLFNPGQGDGGGFYPFGTYPTSEPASNDYQTVLEYSCSTSATGFSLDFKYRQIGGFYKVRRYSISMNTDAAGVTTFGLRDGEPDFDKVECRGALSAKD